MFAAGTSFALGRPYMSTNCAKKNSTPLPLAIFLTASSLGSVATAIAPPCRWPTGCITRYRSGVRVESSTSRAASCVRRRRSERAPKPDELDGDLDHQPVVAAEVDSREICDPAKPLAKCVRVHEERVGGGADVSAAAEKLFERGQQRRAAFPVVFCELRDRIDGRVAGVRLHGDPEEVLVGAELVVADH